MPCEDKLFTVNGRKYKIMQWPVSMVMNKMLKLLKLLAPLGGILSALASGVGETDEIQEKKFSEALTQAAALGKLDSEELSRMLVELTSDVFAEKLPEKIDPDSYFTDFPQDFFPVAYHVAKIQFFPFLGGLSLISAITEKANKMKELQSQKT